MGNDERGQKEAHCQKEVESIKDKVARLRFAQTSVKHQMERECLLKSSVGILLVHIPLKLHISISVMNNGNNAFSHQLMTIFVHVAELSL